MRKIILKFSIFVLTLSLGLGAFYLFIFKESIKQKQENVSISPITSPNKQESPDDFDPWKLPEDFPPLKKGEFFNVGHGCGNGYVDLWLAYDGSHLYEGFNSMSRKDFDNEIKNAGEIIEKLENYPNKYGQKGLRVTIKGINEKTGKEYYSIFWFGKWFKKNNGRYFIDAPNLELAFELEKKMIQDSQKNTK